MDHKQLTNELKKLLLLEDNDINIIHQPSNNKYLIQIVAPHKTFIELNNYDSSLSFQTREILSRYESPDYSIKCRSMIPDYKDLYDKLSQIGLEKFTDYNLENLNGSWSLIIHTNKIINISEIENILLKYYLMGDPKINIGIQQMSDDKTNQSEDTFNATLYSALYINSNTNSPSIEIIRKSMKVISMISQWSFIDLDQFKDSDYKNLFKKNKMDEYDVIEYNRTLLQLHELSEELYQNMNTLLSEIRLGKNINRQTDICKLLDNKFNNHITAFNGIEFTSMYRMVLSSYYNIITTYNEFRDNYSNHIKIIQDRYNDEISNSINKLNKTMSEERVKQNNMILKYEQGIRPINSENILMKIEITSKLESSNITEKQKNIILKNLDMDPSLIQQDISYLSEKDFEDLRKKTSEFNAYLVHIIDVLNSKVVDREFDTTFELNVDKMTCENDGLDLLNRLAKSADNSISNFVIPKKLGVDDVETHFELQKILEVGETEYILSLLWSIKEMYSDLLERHAEFNYIKSSLMLDRIEQALKIEFDNVDIELLDIFQLNDRKLHNSRYTLLDYIRKLNFITYDIRYAMDGVDVDKQDIIVDCLVTRSSIDYIKKDDHSETPNS